MAADGNFLDRLAAQYPEASPKFAVEHYLRGLAVYKAIRRGDNTIPASERVFMERGHAATVDKAADISSQDFDAPAAAPISDAFISLMRPASVPLRLTGLRTMPFGTRFFVQVGAITAAQVRQSKGIPVARGDWLTKVLEPRKVAAITVVTNDVLRQPPQVLRANVNELAAATAQAENLMFISPDATGSVFADAANFPSTGDDVAAITADLEHLLNMVDGALLGTAAFIMSGATAIHLSLLRDDNSALAFPTVTPFGGTLCGLPVLVTEAAAFSDSPPYRLIGLMDAARIFWQPGGATLTISTNAGLEMSDSPTGATDTPVGASENLVSLFQADAAGLKSIRTSGWYAADGAGAYFTVDW